MRLSRSEISIERGKCGNSGLWRKLIIHLRLSIRPPRMDRRRGIFPGGIPVGFDPLSRFIRLAPAFRSHATSSRQPGFGENFIFRLFVLLRRFFFDGRSALSKLAKRNSFGKVRSSCFSLIRSHTPARRILFFVQLRSPSLFLTVAVVVRAKLFSPHEGLVKYLLKNR